MKMYQCNRKHFHQCILQENASGGLHGMLFVSMAAFLIMFLKNI